MTEGPSERTTTTSAPAGTRAPGRLRLEEAPPRRPAPVDDRVQPGRRLTKRFPIVVVLCTLLAIAAGYVGKEALLDSTDGRITSAVADPAAPGFEAIAEPTPVMSVAMVDDEGELSSVAIMALSGDERGAVLVLPADTLVDDGVEAAVVLRSAYRGEGEEGLDHALDRLLGFDAGELLALRPRGLAQLLGPAAPLQVTFVDDVVVEQDGASVVRWPAGPSALEAGEVVDAFLAQSPETTELARMGRVEQIWSAWIASISANGASAIAGETESGLGRFLTGLADREAGVSTPAMLVATLPGEEEAQLYSLDPDGTGELLLSAVPFPIAGFDGQRMRVRVLDGTGARGAAVAAAEVLVRAGAEISIIGNAPTFDATETRLLFHREEDRAGVEAMRDALGGGEVLLVEEADVAEQVTVILGPDVGGAGG